MVMYCNQLIELLICSLFPERTIL